MVELVKVGIVLDETDVAHWIGCHTPCGHYPRFKEEDVVSEKKFLTKTQVEKFIESFPEGQIFSVVFEKADGTLRRMVCKQGVTKHLQGGERTYDKNPDNIGVFDVEAPNRRTGEKGDYRCFNGTRVIRVKGGGACIQACDVGAVDEPIMNARGEPVDVE